MNGPSSGLDRLISPPGRVSRRNGATKARLTLGSEAEAAPWEPPPKTLYSGVPRRSERTGEPCLEELA